MKNKLQKVAKSNATLIALFLLALAINSCTKSSSSSGGAAAFAGTWNVTSSCGGSTSLVITSSGSTINFPGAAGNGSCAKPITYSGTVSGNNVVIPTTTYTDNCGNSATIGGAGSISGSTLTLTLTVAASTGSGSCTLTGTK